MTTDQGDFRAHDFDGLVVESPAGDRLLALPIAVLEVLRYASVIQYRRAGRVSRMRVDGHLDRSTQAQDVVADAVQGIQEQAANDAGAVASWGPQDPSPTPPPAPMQPVDPANIPLRVRRGGEWHTIYVTREQYERYEQEGRLSQEPPNEGTQQ